MQAAADGAGEAGGDDGRREGLANGGEEFADLGNLESRHDDDRCEGFGTCRGDVLHHVGSAHLGQDDVEDDRVVTAIGEASDRALAVDGDVDLTPLPDQHLAEGFAGGGVVFDDQDTRWHAGSLSIRNSFYAMRLP